MHSNESDVVHIGASYLYFKTASRAFIPSCMIYMHKRGTKDQQTVVFRGEKTIPFFEEHPKTLFQNIMYHIGNEELNLQLLYMTFINNRDELKEEIIYERTKNNLSQEFRTVWFWFEFLLDEQIKQRKAVDDTVELFLLLDPMRYVTGPAEFKPRYRLYYNHFGNKNFFPIILRSTREECSRLKQVCENIQDKNLINRANKYLNYKDTKSSFAIEREENRNDARLKFEKESMIFVTKGAVSKTTVLELAKAVREDIKEWRAGEIVVADSTTIYHYGARQQDISELTEGILAAAANIIAKKSTGIDTTDKLLLENDSGWDPIAITAAIAFGFVFVHPLQDGNGRVHRALMRLMFKHLNAPRDTDLEIPISIAIEATMYEYDEALEAFSYHAKANTKTYRDSLGRLIIDNDTKVYFKSWNATPQANYLANAVQISEKIAIDELEFLQLFDAAKSYYSEENHKLDDVMITSQIAFYQKEKRISRGMKKKLTSHLKLDDKQVDELVTGVLDVLNRKEGVHEK
jgi:hypothetical protein